MLPLLKVLNIIYRTCLGMLCVIAINISYIPSMYELAFWFNGKNYTFVTIEKASPTDSGSVPEGIAAP